MKNRDGLIEVICQAYDNADFKPTAIATFCNEAADFIAGQMGCGELSGKSANEILEYMSSSSSWSEVILEKAQDLANQGSLVFAVQRGDPHGHICVIRPGLEKTAGRWNCRVPSVMNIGKEVFISKGLNYAFHDIPSLFVWRPSL